MEKHSVSRLFYLFAHLHLLSSDPFSSLILLSSNLSLLSASALLCFSSVHIVGSLTSKLPSINGSNIWFMMVNKNLGVVFLTILKNHGVRQLGRMTYYGKVKFMFQTTNQIMDYSAKKITILPTTLTS